MMATTRPKPKFRQPTNAIRKWCFDAVMTSSFDSFMIFIILSNVMFMCLTHHGQVG